MNNNVAILNVDDDEAGRYAVSRVLRNAGYTVEEAGTGGETLRMASSMAFGLIVLDVNLPDVSGFEVCRRLKSDPKTSYLPVLHLSATSVSSQSRVRGLEAGADGYLTQPVEPEVLVATVRALLRMRRAEEAQSRSEAKFRRLAESNVIGVASGKDDLILEANDAFLKMVGYSAQDVSAGKLTVSGITGPEFLDDYRQAVRELIERGARAPHEKEYVRKDGSRVAALVGSATLDAPPENTWVAFTLDLTERKKLEEQIRQTQKLESLGVLAGGIAHDYNNLLTGIMGCSSLLLDEAQPESKNAELLHTILEASERAADLTRQILAYSGKGRGLVRCISVSEVIRETRELIHSSLEPGISLELDLADVPPIEADADQIQQIVVNLVTNAAESITPGTGQVRARTGYRSPEDYVCIEVSDTGAGMDSETRSKMFDPFFSTKFVGRGLGLAAVSGIVRSYKGYLNVESAPGAGSIVQVYLPVANPASAKVGRGAG